MEKYDDAFKGVPQSRKGSVKSTTNLMSSPLNRKPSKKEQTQHNKIQEANQSMYATL